MYKIRGKIGKKNDDDTVAALGYIFRGGSMRRCILGIKKKVNLAVYMISLL